MSALVIAIALLAPRRSRAARAAPVEIEVA
jgi:hypothetical protein